MGKKKQKLEKLEDQEFIVTDQCFWEQHPKEDYNPLDPKRAPHAITVVNRKNGTIAMIESGSIIKIVKAHKN